MQLCTRNGIQFFLSFYDKALFFYITDFLLNELYDIYVKIVIFFYNFFPSAKANDKMKLNPLMHGGGGGVCSPPPHAVSFCLPFADAPM